MAEKTATDAAGNIPTPEGYFFPLEGRQVQLWFFVPRKAWQPTKPVAVPAPVRESGAKLLKWMMLAQAHAEVHNMLGQLAKDAIFAYEQERASPDGSVKGRFCPSAGAPVPADRSLVSGKKYASAAADWQTDAKSDAGFACLGFSMTQSQYYQYEYKVTATGFVVRAHGDLNGDGVFSTFEMKGELDGDRVNIPATVTETNPDE